MSSRVFQAVETGFVPVRAFLGKQLSRSRPQLLCSTNRTQSRFQANLTARERRRAADHARNLVHKDIRGELAGREDQFVSAVISLPQHVRKRCSLSPRMARVRLFLEKDGMDDVFVFKGRVRSGLVRIFPELEHRGLLRLSDNFDVKVAGGDVVNDLPSLQKGLARCSDAGSPVYVEVVPHNIPAPLAPLSDRVKTVKRKAAAASADPNLQLHMVSFYKFVRIPKPELACSLLHKAWSRLGVKGRVYVAQEGVNAQLAVPDPLFQDFLDAMDGSWREKGESVIPSELLDIFMNVDRIVHHSEQPFEKLNVRERDKILADGFTDPLDWNCSGREVPPDEWHKILMDKKDDVIVLDCRNEYESGVGRFKGAEPLDTQTFRESWTRLEKRLAHEDREKPILTYCTGGIRCVKVNAFLEQKMGFTNTGRLHGGIVSYARQLRESGKLSESAFTGVNHVFDGRMGEVITDDLLDRCITCDQLCNIQSDCANVNCSRPFQARMFVQCEDCAKIMNGACSLNCRNALPKSGTLLERSQDQPFRLQESDSDRYADAFSVDEDPLLRELRIQTEARLPNRAHMLSSHSQASFLRMLVQITGCTRVLEIGTFTGYATLAMASGLPVCGRVDTCELDEEIGEMAQSFFGRDTVVGKKICLRQGKAMRTLQALGNEGARFGLVFIDADKGGYRAYTEYLLDHGLITKGGLLVCDNVLFRGEVAEIWAKSELQHSKDATAELVRKRVRNLENVKRIAHKLHDFNTFLKHEHRLEQVMIPMRDGLTIARVVS